jgi:glutathione S-transferase
MSSELTTILAEVRAQIARGDEPDSGALEARIRALPEHERALAQLNRLLAVHRAKRSLATPVPAPPQPPARRAAVYRAKPTIAATMPVRARAADGVVVLEWDARPGVTQWEARVSERPDARSAYPDGERRALDAPRLDLQLGEQPKRVHIAGRNAAGRVVARALVSGLTSTNWSRRWLQRPTAS